MKIENAELNEIPPPIEKILEFDVEDLHFRMMISEQVDSLISDSFAKLHPAYCISCLVQHKLMGTQLSLASEYFTFDLVESKWKELRERFVLQAIANKHLLAKPINSVKLRV